MTKSLSDALADFRSTVGAVSGMRAAPDGIPDVINVFPFFVAWPGGGEIIKQDSTTVLELWSLTGQLHIARRDLRTAAAQADTLLELIKDALFADVTLGATCEHFGSMSISPLQPMSWGDPQVETIGYEITLNGVKVRSDAP